MHSGKEEYISIEILFTPSSQPTQVHSVVGLFTSENEDAWRQYLDKLLDNALHRETMDTVEFKAAEESAKNRGETTRG